MEAAEKQLDFLNETMKDTAAEANDFLKRYHFGGIVAVIALLNVDLIFLKGLSLDSPLKRWGFLAVLSLVFALSYVYFRFIISHYNRFALSHRKLKYKYELTLHYALCGKDVASYQYYLERGLDAGPPDTSLHCFKGEPESGYEFKAVANYLLAHHAERLRKIKSGDESRYFIWAAML